MYLTTSRLEGSQQQWVDGTPSLLDNTRGNEMTCTFEEGIHVEYVASKAPIDHEYLASKTPTNHTWCLASDISQILLLKMKKQLRQQQSKQ